MHKIRVRKSVAEVANMRLAGKVSGEAFNRAMGMTAREEFSTEKQLWAFLEHEFRRGGCDGEAYVPVVAGGEVCGFDLVMPGVVLIGHRMR